MNAKFVLLAAGFFSAFLLEFNRALAQALPANPVPEYMLVDLGALGGYYSSAQAINDRGQVVGALRDNLNINYSHAFLYSEGVLRDLGTLGGTRSEALGINDLGQVVGTSYTPGDTESPIFLYSDGSMKNLGKMGAYWLAKATGINNKGEIVGWQRNPWGYYRSFLVANGKDTDIGTLGANSCLAYAINNSGQIVGESQVIPGQPRAFLYSNGTMKDLNIPEADQSVAYGINNSGQIIGSFISNSPPQAFLYFNGSTKKLGALKGNYSIAYGINDSGYVVGTSSAVLPPASVSHAFLYVGNIMFDLNSITVPNHGWVFISAQAINNKGQIVGIGNNPKKAQRSFLLNPLPSGWRKAIAETLPTRPTYSACPEKLPDKDSLVIVTHGWVPKKEEGQTAPPNPDWVDEMTKTIRQNLQDRGLNNWQVESYKWTEKAWFTRTKLLTGDIFLNAEAEGINLGNCLKDQGWKHLHLIGHSAGSALIQACALRVKARTDITTTVHTTFLDAYVGIIYGGREKYGAGADWSDSYFARDPETYDGLFSRTKGHLDHAYGVDVTWLEPNKRTIYVHQSGSGLTGTVPCPYTVTTHGWPHEFYMRTIPPSTVFRANGFGYTLSKEGGGWDTATNEYKVEVNSSLVRVLGIPDTDCTSLGGNTLPTYPSPKMDFEKVQTIPSGTGTFKKSGGGLTITSTGRMQPQSLQEVGKQEEITSGNAWLAIPLSITNTINSLSFEAQFADPSGGGLLTVYWQTNTIGSIDESKVMSGFRQYSYSFPLAVNNDVCMLGFRLDSFSTVSASVVITNVSLGLIGMTNAISLTSVGTDSNGIQTFRLIGPEGFNYRLESSTNLSAWSTIAILVNTNGSVNFAEPKPVQESTRFYRAVLP